MNKPLVSFVIPNRGVSPLDTVIKNINEMFADYSPEVIVVTQDDDDLFKRGQLFNIGVQFAHANNLMLSDNDFVYFHTLHLDKIYRFFNTPFSCFLHMQHVYVTPTGFRLGELKRNKAGNGGVNFITKEDYYKINGMSNLYCGWGAEDDEYRARVVNLYGKWNKVPVTLGHIWHPSRMNKNKYNTELNYEFLANRNKFDYHDDGINQTTCNVVDKRVDGNTTWLKVNRISVTDTFRYKDELARHYRSKASS